MRHPLEILNIYYMSGILHLKILVAAVHYIPEVGLINSKIKQKLLWRTTPKKIKADLSACWYFL
jgi:hypothetical protein